MVDEKDKLYKQKTEESNKTDKTLEEQFKELDQLMTKIDQDVKMIENENNRNHK